ncbi:MAG: mitochondrial fission ELM1 family protein [Alphaproteobacteria bacterium]|nr:mitochondrial fission ELM1 family protein [Alphaproteobacteria bacterium]
MKKTIWALFDNRMGSIGQARGILQELEGEYDITEKKIVYNRFSGLPNCLRGSHFLIGVDKKASDDITKEPFPDIVLSISRRTAPIALWIKRRSQNKTKIVQLMFPGNYGLKNMDLVIVSEHDRGKSNAKNLFYITGCPHRINEKTLSEARQKWEKEFSSLPRPLTAVLVGGAIKGHPFSNENAALLGDYIASAVKKSGGSILITSSRRTGKAAEDIIMDKIKSVPAYTYLWGEKKENPIMGFYALADQIIVTGDSVSMTCEACGTGSKVMVFTGKNWLTKKHLRFVQSLIDGGYAIVAQGDTRDDFTPKSRLEPSIEAAEAIRRL